jgi:hypothetical protein
MRLTGKLALILTLYLALLMFTLAMSSLAVDLLFWIATIALVVFSLRGRGRVGRTT